MINSEKVTFVYQSDYNCLLFLTDTCTPGSTWQQDCNTCTCTENGLAICTLKACLPRQTRQVSCKFNMKKLCDKLNSTLPKDYSYLELVPVWFGGFISAL